MNTVSASERATNEAMSVADHFMASVSPLLPYLGAITIVGVVVMVALGFRQGRS